MHILCKEAKIDHKQLNDHVKINLTISFSLSKYDIYWKWAKKWTLESLKSQIAILLLNQCSISAVFPIVRFAGDQKTALPGEPLYLIFNITHCASDTSALYLDGTSFLSYWAPKHHKQWHLTTPERQLHTTDINTYCSMKLSFWGIVICELGFLFHWFTVKSRSVACLV